MKEITKEAAHDMGLPKWPQCLITGPAVRLASAKEIIFRTDSFLTSPYEYSGGNNGQWNDWARRTLGYDMIFSKASVSADNMVKIRAEWAAADLVRKKMGFFDLHYLMNSWASCAYIYGPHGWCHPDGRIYFCDNIGKWPSVAEVDDDLSNIGAAFPFVELWLTLMNKEHSEEGASPVVTMHLEGGKITFYEGTLEPFEGVPKSRGEGALEHAALSLFSHKRREQGLPDSWVEELGERTRPIVEQALKEVNANGDQNGG